MKQVIKISFLLILIFKGMNGFTQIAGAKNYIGISGGFSLPLGDFANSDFADPNSGFAKTGSNFNIDAVHYFHKNVGLGALIGYSVWSIDAQPLSDGFTEAFAVDSTTVNVSGNNSSLHALFGPYISFPFGKLTVNFRWLAGITHTRLPAYQVLLEDGLDNSFGQLKADQNALALQAGAGLLYAITDHIGLSLRADYYISRPVFEISNSNRTNSAGRMIESYTASINSINSTIGIFYKFGK